MHTLAVSIRVVVFVSTACGDTEGSSVVDERETDLLTAYRVCAFVCVRVCVPSSALFSKKLYCVETKDEKNTDGACVRRRVLQIRAWVAACACFWGARAGETRGGVAC